jgi:hypothetical protein
LRVARAPASLPARRHDAGSPPRTSAAR